MLEDQGAALPLPIAAASGASAYRPPLRRSSQDIMMRAGLRLLARPAHGERRRPRAPVPRGTPHLRFPPFCPCSQTSCARANRAPGGALLQNGTGGKAVDTALQL